MISQFRGPVLLQGQKFVYIEIFPSVWTQRYFDIVRTSSQLVFLRKERKQFVQVKVFGKDASREDACAL